MEDGAYKHWNYIKGILVEFPKETKNRPYLTEEEMQKFEAKLKRAFREKKLKRILNI